MSINEHTRTHRVLGSLVIFRLENRTISLEETACSLEDKALRELLPHFVSCNFQWGNFVYGLVPQGKDRLLGKHHS